MGLLKKGDSIRLKVRTMSGWKGNGIVAKDQLIDSNIVYFWKDKDPKELLYRCEACRHEVAKIKDKS